MLNSSHLNGIRNLPGAGFLLLLLLVFALPGCSPLPHYALPQTRKSDKRVTGEVINYRRLTIDDFQSYLPPEHIEAHYHKINAHTAVILQLREGAKIVIERLPATSLGLNYRVYGTDLAFDAVMVPERSWWNPDVPKKLTGYVLQHEQIHFALMEITARQLNRKLAREREAFDILTNNTGEAKQQIAGRIDRMLAQANEQTLRDHTAFDEDTSGIIDRKAQNRWYAKVTDQLAQLSQP